MKQYDPFKIRNVVFLSHSGVGKTTLLEHLLYNQKVITRLGSVDEGNSQLDYLPFEIDKKFTISSKIFPIETKEIKTNIIDTPGYPDFFGEVVGSISIAENAVLLVDAYAGVQISTLKMWRITNNYNVSKAIFINKMEKENANFENCLETIKKQLTNKILVMQLPMGEGENFKGIIDLITMKAYLAAADNSAPKPQDIPDEYKEQVDEYRLQLIESIAETNEELLEKYFADEKLSEEELFSALKNAIKTGQLTPVLCGSAALNVGINNLLEKIEAIFVSPASREKVTPTKIDSDETVEIPIKNESEFSGLIFKSVVEEHLGELTYIKCNTGTLSSGDDVINSRTGNKERIGQISVMIGKKREETGKVTTGDIATLVKLKDTKIGDTLSSTKLSVKFPDLDFPSPVISSAVTPKAKKDQEKLISGLNTFAQEDPTFTVKLDKLFNELIISGMGELHLDLMLKKLKQKFGVELEVNTPKIPYKETIKKKTQAQGKYKKQSGGRGQYGDCWLKVEPLKKGSGIEFESAIFGGSIPSKYIPAVEKGVRDALEKGYLAGYPMTDIKVTLYDGSYHDVDSSDLAFQIAGSFGIKNACETAKPVLLEPIMELEVHIPENYMGDVMGDLNSRRGKVSGMDSKDGISVVKAMVPQKEMHKYATDLRSLTRGEGDFYTKFAYFEEVPREISQKIIQEAKQSKEEEK